MFSEICIHIIFQLIVSAVAFWWFFGPELSHNISLLAKSVLNITIPESVKQYFPERDYTILEDNFKLVKIHFMVVVLILPIIYAILFYRNGSYIREVRTLAVIYSVFVPVNILFSRLFAPKVLLNDDNVYNTIIREEKEKLLFK